MDKGALIREAYGRFGGFARPDRCTRHDDDCPDCRDHHRTLSLVDRKSLSMAQIGPVSWSPLAHLNARAMAYFMPRLMELALLNEVDCDEEPFVVRFLAIVLEGPAHHAFELFQTPHREVVFMVLSYIKANHTELVKREGWSGELETAIVRWRVIHRWHVISRRQLS